MERVQAQEARRFLDRVVGYRLSPLLSRKLARHLSAGRVQSVAVRLVVEREREIQNFKPEEYWKITAMLAPEGTVAKPVKGKALSRKKKAKTEQNGQNGEAEAPAALEVPPGAFLAELAEWAGKKFEAHAEQEATPIVSALQGASYVVAKIEQKDRLEKAAPPFTTSTLQQQASIRLRYPARKTMMLAQRL